MKLVKLSSFSPNLSEFYYNIMEKYRFLLILRKKNATQLNNMPYQRYWTYTRHDSVIQLVLFWARWS